jgi:hypothetical protein
LQSERDLLKSETEKLRFKRDQYIEEAQKLNAKNSELAELNNELLKQIESQHKGKSHNFNIFKSKSPQGYHHHTDSNVKIPGHIKAPSLYNLETDISEGDPLQKVAHRNSIGRGVTAKKFKWKKGISKILQNAVNGIPPNIGIPMPTNESRSETNMKIRNELLGNYAMSRTHNWQQFNLTSPVPVKCDHCGEKMWGGAELKCSGIIFKKKYIFFLNYHFLTYLFNNV